MEMQSTSALDNMQSVMKKNFEKMQDTFQGELSKISCHVKDMLGGNCFVEK